MVRDREKWMFRVKSVLKVLDLSIDENEVVCTVGQAAEALDALGPIVSLLIAFQSQQEARNWIDKVVGVAALRSNYLEEIQRH